MAAPPQAAPGPLGPIIIDNLSKNFGKVRAVDNFSCRAHPGRVTGFLGPNGAGKTTTLRMLVGLASIDGGSATFGGTRYAQLAAPQQAVGVSIEANFHPGRTGRNHLKVLAATAGVDRNRIEEVLHLTEIAYAADRKVGGYSMGMKQRLALAAALLGDPDYLILDEPANGLDPEGIRWLRGFLRSYAARGKVVFVSSHMLGEMQATVDDLVVIGNGRLLHEGSLADLEFHGAATRVRVQDLDRCAAALREQGFDVHREDDRQGPCLMLPGANPIDVGQRLFHLQIPVWELTQHKVDLEQNFFKMLEARR